MTIGSNAGNQRLYVTNNRSHSISGFSVASNGALTALPGSPYVTAMPYPESLTVNPAATCLFVANGSGTSGDI